MLVVVVDSKKMIGQIQIEKNFLEKIIGLGFRV